MCPTCQVAIWKAWPDPLGPPSRQPSQSTNRDPRRVAWGAWAKTCKRSPLKLNRTMIFKRGATNLGIPKTIYVTSSQKGSKTIKTDTEISRVWSQSRDFIWKSQIPWFGPNAFASKAAGIGKGLRGCCCCWNMFNMSGNCCGAWVFKGYFVSVGRLRPMLWSSAIHIDSLSLLLSQSSPPNMGSAQCETSSTKSKHSAISRTAWIIDELLPCWPS